MQWLGFSSNEKTTQIKLGYYPNLLWFLNFDAHQNLLSCASKSANLITFSRKTKVKTNAIKAISTLLCLWIQARKCCLIK